MTTNVQQLVEQLLTEKPNKPNRKELEKGLTQEQAIKAFPWNSKMGDCRGFSYDPKTGIATWM